MEKNFISRLIASLLLTIVMLTPAIFGLHILNKSLAEQKDLSFLFLLGVILILASLFWVYKRSPEIIQSISKTDELNEKFKERLKNVALDISFKPNSFVYRKFWTLVFSPAMWALLYLIFNWQQVSLNDVFALLGLTIVMDYLTFSSSVLVWYWQRKNKVYKFFILVPFATVDLAKAKSYYWIGKGTIRNVRRFHQLVFLDQNLKKVGLLPIETCAFPESVQKVLNQCIQLPGSLRI